MNNIVIKLYHSEEIRRLNLPKTTSYKDFTTKICDFFNYELSEEFAKKLTFKYTDEEGDIVTFTSEEEWKNLLETFKGTSVLKITFELKNEKTIKSCRGRRFHERSEWKKNKGESKEDGEKLEPFWKNFCHEKRNWRNNESFSKDWKERKGLEIEKLKENKTFEKEILILNSMGFCDEFLNYRLLQKYEGNVKRVISKIIKKTNKREKICNWRRHFKKERDVNNIGDENVKENENVKVEIIKNNQNCDKNEIQLENIIINNNSVNNNPENIKFENVENLTNEIKKK